MSALSSCPTCGCTGHMTPESRIDLLNEAGIFAQVTRFEVIDWRKDTTGGGGRVLMEQGVEVRLSLQDNDRTLKVFLTEPQHETV